MFRYFNMTSMRKRGRTPHPVVLDISIYSVRSISFGMWDVGKIYSIYILYSILFFFFFFFFFVVLQIFYFHWCHKLLACVNKSELSLFLFVYWFLNNVLFFVICIFIIIKLSLSVRSFQSQEPCILMFSKVYEKEINFFGSNRNH